MTIEEIAVSKYGLCIEECEYLEDKSVWIATLSNGITAYQDDDKSGKEPVAWRRLHKYCKENNVHLLGMCLKFRSNIITIKSPDDIDGFYFSYGVQREFDEEVTRAYYVCGYLKSEEINYIWYRTPELLEEKRGSRKATKEDFSGCRLIVNTQSVC